MHVFQENNVKARKEMPRYDIAAARSYYRWYLIQIRNYYLGTKLRNYQGQDTKPETTMVFPPLSLSKEGVLTDQDTPSGTMDVLPQVVRYARLCYTKNETGVNKRGWRGTILRGEDLRRVLDDTLEMAPGDRDRLGL